MLRSAFVSRVYWALVALVCATLVILVVDLEIFGSPAREFVRGILIDPALAIYGNHKWPIDTAAFIIGTSVPAVTGGLAILKGFYYAEMNLPRRLQELADANHDRHLHDRPAMLGYVQGTFSTKDFLTPTILANPFAQVLQIFGWETLRTKARDIANATDALKGEIENLAKCKADAENRKVTGHLLRGACLAVDADRAEPGSLERTKHLESALTEYESALELRKRDLDALQGAAKHSGDLGDIRKHRRYLNRLIWAAQGDTDEHRILRARALYQSAVVLNQSHLPTDQREARERLWSIRELLDEEKPEQRLILGEAYLLYGEIQSKRDRRPTAKRALTRAVELFGNHEGVRRAQQALKSV